MVTSAVASNDYNVFILRCTFVAFHTSQYIGLIAFNPSTLYAYQVL
jgi:hypothetical protein